MSVESDEPQFERVVDGETVPLQPEDQEDDSDNREEPK